jgi:hypothetical protein
MARESAQLENVLRHDRSADSMRRSRVKACVRSGVVASLVGALGALGCGGGPTLRVPPSPRLAATQLHDPATLPADELAAFTRRPRHDYRQTISISVVEGVSGRGFEGRGALVVRPSRALRMILLGPGGATAMDTWIGDGRFRVEIPALARVARGDARTPSAQLRGLPVALLWRWVVDPFGGSIVAARVGRVRAGGVVDDPTRAGFVAFARLPTAFEIRARVRVPDGLGVQARGEGWWIEHGALVGHVVAEDRALDDGGRLADFPARIEYVSLDPPMSVRVQVEETTVLEPGAIPDAAFEDPDRP